MNPQQVCSHVINDTGWAGDLTSGWHGLPAGAEAGSGCEGFGALNPGKIQGFELNRCRYLRIWETTYRVGFIGLREWGPRIRVKVSLRVTWKTT